MWALFAGSPCLAAGWAPRSAHRQAGEWEVCAQLLSPEQAEPSLQGSSSSRASWYLHCRLEHDGEAKQNWAESSMRTERDLQRPGPVATGVHPLPIPTFTVAHQYSPINKRQIYISVYILQIYPRYTGTQRREQSTHQACQNKSQKVWNSWVLWRDFRKSHKARTHRQCIKQKAKELQTILYSENYLKNANHVQTETKQDYFKRKQWPRWA